MAFTFDGISSSGLLIDNKVIHSVLPPVRARLLQVPGRPGAFDFGAGLGAREIEVEVTIVGSSQADLRTKVRRIAEWLYHEELKPLVFADEPDKTYYARCDGATDLDEIVNVGRGSIKFVCPDPLAYGTAMSQVITGNPNVVNLGTYQAFPKITATFSVSAPYFKVMNGTKSVLVNRSFAAGDVLVLDHQKNLVTVNGSRVMASLDLSSEFFALETGSNGLTVEPPSVASTTVDWTERWL